MYTFHRAFPRGVPGTPFKKEQRSEEYKGEQWGRHLGQNTPCPGKALAENE